MSIPRFPRAGAVAKWVLAAVAVAAGCYVLLDFWMAFNRFAVNGSRGRPPGWHPEIMFLYALPGFEAGLLVGLFLTAASRGVGHVLSVLNVAVWAENGVNLAFIFFLVSQGALL